jgi:hypothetical protein
MTPGTIMEIRTYIINCILKAACFSIRDMSMKTQQLMKPYVIYFSVSMIHVQNTIKSAITALKRSGFDPKPGFFGGEITTGTSLSQSTSVFPCQTIPPLLPTYIALT